MSRRIEKIADQIQYEVAELLHRDVKHPVLTAAMVSITRVEVAPDLAHARLHVSVLEPGGGDLPTLEGIEDLDGAEHDEDAVAVDTESVIEALRRTEPFLHRELAKRLHLRRVPRLQFFADYSIAEGDRMATIMREVRESDGQPGRDGGQDGHDGQEA